MHKLVQEQQWDKQRDKTLRADLEDKIRLHMCQAHGQCSDKELFRYDRRKGAAAVGVSWLFGLLRLLISAVVGTVAAGYTFRTFRKWCDMQVDTPRMWLRTTCRHTPRWHAPLVPSVAACCAAALLLRKVYNVAFKKSGRLQFVL